MIQLAFASMPITRASNPLSVLAHRALSEPFAATAALAATGLGVAAAALATKHTAAAATLR
eukprot:CAMPEP_0184386388 /NCGR_PEP_ID=MMETSP0007-20130409/9735_1 /TAXON_ID=97485 /ORGANISM="Prymnesium parvum, Strain Texoma1" /LENGTH=60 /DNA_ID=CAMNT_0026734215 /DNA_START=454 /DNA_END=632 /DNA_ORIENTATION=-